MLLHRNGNKQFHHPVVGDMTLAFEVMDLADADLTLTAYSADRGSPAEDGIALLARWAATLDAAVEGDPVMYGADRSVMAGHP